MAPSPSKHLLAVLLLSAAYGANAAAQETLPLAEAPMPQAISAPSTYASTQEIRGTIPGAIRGLDAAPCGTYATSSEKTPHMSCLTEASAFHRFLNSAQPQSMTPREKFQLAAKNVGDPFNLLTIAGDAAVSVGSHPHWRYGPGMEGWAKYSGVSLTQDMTAEFLVTFLVPSIVHQDPRYRRTPNASYLRRLGHCITQPVRAQSDTGRPMPNYAYIFGISAADTISNIYVPGREQGTWPTAARVAVALGSAPIDNFITEFLPDVARHVNVRIVLLQRVINRVALTEGQQ